MKCAKCGMEPKSLAVLADEKGFDVNYCRYDSVTVAIDLTSQTSVTQDEKSCFQMRTYQEAEDKARTYLEELK